MSIPSFSVLCNSAIKSHVHLFFNATFPCEFGIFLLVRSFQTLQPLLVLLRVGFMLDQSTVTIILSFDFLFIAFLFHREPSLSFMIPSLSVHKNPFFISFSKRSLYISQCKRLSPHNRLLETPLYHLHVYNKREADIT